MATYADFNGYSKPKYDYVALALPPAPTPQESRAKLLEEERAAGELYAEKQRQKEEVRVQRNEAVKGWFRSGTTGQRVVFGVFLGAIALGLTLFFVIPRVPSIEWDANSPLTSNDRKAIISSGSFSFLANVSLNVDSRASYIPVRISTLGVEIYDLTTSQIIATGSLAEGTTIGAQSTAQMLVPVSFIGRYSNSSNPTFSELASSCSGNSTNRPGLSLALAVSLTVQGLLGTKGSTSQLTSVACPVFT